MKFKTVTKIETEQEVNIELPYYAQRYDYRYMALLSETQMLTVGTIGEDFRNITLSTPSKSDIAEMLSGVQITEADFREVYDTACVEIDQATPFDLKKQFAEALPY